MLKTLEKTYIVISMLFLAQGVLQVAVAENDTQGRLPSRALLIGQLLIFAILAVLSVVRWREMLHGLLHSGWIVALVSLAVFSCAWSSDPLFTLRRAIFLVATTVFAIYIASCFDWDEQLSMFGWLSVLAIAGSAFMIAFFPEYGISLDLHYGSYKGLFPHRSALARQMLFGILILSLGKPKGIPNWVRYLCLFGACVMLVFSHAATSMVAAALCLALYPLVHLIRVRRRNTLPIWVPFVPIVAAIGAFVLANFNFVLEAAGRSSTLTGRVPIWTAVIEAVSKKPLLGYGYDVFWNRESGDLRIVRGMINPAPTHAHNGYLDVLLALGAVGLVIFLCGFIVNLWRAGRLFQDGSVNGAKWPLLFLIFFATFNLTESNILRLLTFLWVPYVSVFVSLALMQSHARVPGLVPDGDLDPDDETDGPQASRAIPQYGV